MIDRLDGTTVLVQDTGTAETQGVQTAVEPPAPMAEAGVQALDGVDELDEPTRSSNDQRNGDYRDAFEDGQLVRIDHEHDDSGAYARRTADGTWEVVDPVRGTSGGHSEARVRELLSENMGSRAQPVETDRPAPPEPTATEPTNPEAPVSPADPVPAAPTSPTVENGIVENGDFRDKFVNSELVRIDHVNAGIGKPGSFGFEREYAARSDDGTWFIGRESNRVGYAPIAAGTEEQAREMLVARIADRLRTMPTTPAPPANRLEFDGQFTSRYRDGVLAGIALGRLTENQFFRGDGGYAAQRASDGTFTVVQYDARAFARTVATGLSEADARNLLIERPAPPALEPDVKHGTSNETRDVGGRPVEFIVRYQEGALQQIAWKDPRGNRSALYDTYATPNGDGSFQVVYLADGRRGTQTVHAPDEATALQLLIRPPRR